MVTHHEAHIRRLYAAISAGVTGEGLRSFFHREAEQVEYPSVMRPQGGARPLAEMLAASDLGARIIVDQEYDVHTVIESGDHVAVQLTWSATTTADLGAIEAGTRLRAHVAAFYVFSDDVIVRQSSYDCYEPIQS